MISAITFRQNLLHGRCVFVIFQRENTATAVMAIFLNIPTAITALTAIREFADMAFAVYFLPRIHCSPLEPLRYLEVAPDAVAVFADIAVAVYFRYSP